MKKNYFITLEGIEGAGKSTAVRFLAEYLRKFNIDFILTREPGGTEIAEKIRRVILDHYQEKMHPDTEMLLYFAGRAQHLNQVIIPALQRGQWVICDRFTDATYAYQGGGRGLSQEKISILEQWVQSDLRPDHTLLFDVTVTIGLSRIKKNRYLDRIEKEEEFFFEKVRNCYLERAGKEPDRFHILDANKNPEEVSQQIENILKKLINK
ncbi:MAG TPA: dTMP kinase [Coxiellaceae bacterium]|nr:MAG: dTMP kinase [Gammaproteobacteria bacterium RBG_16_37_9]HBS52218.1 dTMP kinase [Coxiellaceae bacterium]HBY56059.1 dTMP kinase [Coxiellaceae bacterium]